MIWILWVLITSPVQEVAQEVALHGLEVEVVTTYDQPCGRLIQVTDSLLQIQTQGTLYSLSWHEIHRIRLLGLKGLIRQTTRLQAFSILAGLTLGEYALAWEVTHVGQWGSPLLLLISPLSLFTWIAGTPLYNRANGTVRKIYSVELTPPWTPEKIQLLRGYAQNPMGGSTGLSLSPVPEPSPPSLKVRRSRFTVSPFGEIALEAWGTQGEILWNSLTLTLSLLQLTYRVSHRHHLRLTVMSVGFPWNHDPLFYPAHVDVQASYTLTLPVRPPTQFRLAFLLNPLYGVVLTADFQRAVWKRNLWAFLGLRMLTLTFILFAEEPPPPHYFGGRWRGWEKAWFVPGPQLYYGLRFRLPEVRFRLPKGGTR